MHHKKLLDKHGHTKFDFDFSHKSLNILFIRKRNKYFATRN